MDLTPHSVACTSADNGVCTAASKSARSGVFAGSSGTVSVAIRITDGAVCKSALLVGACTVLRCACNILLVKTNCVSSAFDACGKLALIMDINKCKVGCPKGFLFTICLTVLTSDHPLSLASSGSHSPTRARYAVLTRLHPPARTISRTTKHCSEQHESSIRPPLCQNHKAPLRVAPEHPRPHKAALPEPINTVQT